VQADAHCDDLESQKNLLTEQNKELQLQLGRRAAENEEAFSILSKKAPEWEVCSCVMCSACLCMCGECFEPV